MTSETCYFFKAFWHLSKCFNSRPFFVLRHLRQWRGGCDPPPCVSKLSVVELSGKNSGLPRRVLAIGGAFLDPKSIFDRWPSYERSNVNFREIDNFSILHPYITKSMSCSGLKLSPACSPFNSKQNGVFLQFVDWIFVTHSISETNSVTLIAKITWGQTGSVALIYIG